MTAPALLTAHDSGLYRSPAGIELLRKRAEVSGAEWLSADLKRTLDKAQVLKAIAEACDFPATFGGNWDALADNLQDLSWRPAPGYVLHLRHAAAAAQGLGREWSTLLQILAETAVIWKDRGLAFVALVDGAVDLPAWT